MKRMPKKRKRIGSRLALCLLVLQLTLGNCLLEGQGKGKKPPSFSVIAGTVFRPPGFALPGAEVTLKPEKGKGQQRMISNMRGEFAFRVPSEFARYTVSVKAKGFEKTEKMTEVGIEQRVDVAFELKPSD